MQSWLHDSDIEIYSTQNEKKFIVAERFIRTLKSKIYKYMTIVLKLVYINSINKLSEIVDKYQNQANVQLDPYIDCIIRMVWSIMTKILNSKLVTM